MRADSTDSGFGNFCEYLAARLERDLPAEPNARLIEDLGLDSIGIYEAVVLVEELGVDMVETIDGIETLGHLYDLYQASPDKRPIASGKRSS